MKIICEESVRNFGFWSGGKDRADGVKCDADWDIIDNELESIYPDGMTDDELNNLFWFDFDTIAQWLGYKSEEHYFYGAAQDGYEMAEIIIDRFHDASSDAIDEWVDSEWEPNWTEEKCLNEFSNWYYSRYAKDRTAWIDMVFDDAEGNVCTMKWFIRDKDLNEKTAEDWLEEYNEWTETQSDWIEEHFDEINSIDYGF